MNVVYAREPLPNPLEQSIFLMGPTPRDNHVRSWRPTAIEQFRYDGFQGTLLVPEERPDEDGNVVYRGDYTDQVEWELAALAQATIIMAWIPRDPIDLPGFTTNVEWGRWENSGKMILGYPTFAAKMNYISHYADQFDIPVASTLRSTTRLALLAVGLLADRDCIFCEIAHHDPHGQIEWRGQDSVVITPLREVVPGHKLVIPRVHVADSMDAAITGRTMADAARYVTEFDLHPYNIVTSAGSVATQTVFHLHLHILPRREGDGMVLPWTAYEEALRKRNDPTPDH